MMEHTMSNYNYIRQPETMPKQPEKDPVPHPDPSLNPNLESGNLSKNKPTDTETAATENYSNSNYSPDFKDL